MAWRGGGSTSDRFWSGLVYLLPIAESIGYAMALLQILPASLQSVAVPILAPVIKLGMIYGTIVGMVPLFGHFLVFMLLFVLVVQNRNLPHFIRYNTMQAMMIGIMTTLVTLIFEAVNLSVTIVGSQRASDPINAILLYFFATIFLAVLAACVYSLVHVVQGKYAEIKWVSEASYAQTR